MTIDEIIKIGEYYLQRADDDTHIEPAAVYAAIASAAGQLAMAKLAHLLHNAAIAESEMEQATDAYTNEVKL